MQKTSLSLAIIGSLLVIIFLVEPVAESVYAQSAKPSPPVFSTRVVYTGSIVIEFKITNQPFTNSSTVNAISYPVRARDPSKGIWVQTYADSNYDLQSNGTYTTLLMPLPHSLQNASSVDLQMQAQTGYYSRIYKQGQMPEAPFPTDGYWEDNFNPAEKSDWSNTQAVNLNQAATTSPTQVPEFSWLAILPLLLSIFSVVVVLRHRKTTNSGGYSS
jgi:hypothetical protein